ncbi:hypothetical protein [Rhodopirellula baltica]|uniref:Uncharacterized protein n=1 Tax=Rhodopirellula baltica SWK14 TaxID=993516 RepID=L7CL40_RHOBT|nr:hypothetical protein [Rhodopirellula baltica]ELP34555.1 hypothetical protein RBSWK_01565 [Rhodopirellula baltica SWK14]
MSSSVLTLIATTVSIVLMPLRLVSPSSATPVVDQAVVSDEGWTQEEWDEYQLEVERMIGEGGA